MTIHINWYGEDKTRHKLQGLFKEPVYGNFLDVRYMTVEQVRNILNDNFNHVEEPNSSIHDAWFIIHSD